MLKPDRKADVVKTMADEVDFANVIRLVRLEGYWSATIGPSTADMVGYGSTPFHAVCNLMIQCETGAWPFDESWRDRLEA